MREIIPQARTEFDDTAIVERPDGFYWQAKDERREHGPFGSLLEAVEDMQRAADGAALEPGETLEEAGAEIGIATWIDPETGVPAEEERPRLEEH